jgi:hypothetical protein
MPDPYPAVELRRQRVLFAQTITTRRSYNGSWLPGGKASEGIVQSKTMPVLAKAIKTTPEALIVVVEDGAVSIPWERCSARLARASAIERNRAELSPSGYGIHWPLIDEDLAVGPLVRATA